MYKYVEIDNKKNMRARIVNLENRVILTTVTVTAGKLTDG
jgi:hypothetical protein